MLWSRGALTPALFWEDCGVRAPRLHLSRIQNHEESKRLNLGRYRSDKFIVPRNTLAPKVVTYRIRSSWGSKDTR